MPPWDEGFRPQICSTPLGGHDPLRREQGRSLGGRGPRPRPGAVLGLQVCRAANAESRSPPGVYGAAPCAARSAPSLRFEQVARGPGPAGGDAWRLSRRRRDPWVLEEWGAAAVRPGG